jgi:tetratricopeptide (TPR) repeat protein
MKRILAIPAAGLMLISCARQNQSALKTPQAPSAMDRQVLNAVDAGDGDAELRLLRSRVIDSPQSITARLELGRAYEQRGYPELALDHYRWAAEHAPDSADAHLMLARALARTEHGPEAIAALAGFLNEHPQPGPTLYSWLGIMRDDAADWKGSEQAYREALAKSPEDRDYLHNNLGFSLLKQGEYQKASDEFRAALKLNPGSEIARGNLATALASSPGREKEAIVNWQSMNEPAVAHSNLAAVLIDQGKYAEARKELQAALQYNRTNPAALKNLELLSRLDGKAAMVPAPVGQRTPWAKVKSAWRHFWVGDGQHAVQQQVETASK